MGFFQKIRGGISSFFSSTSTTTNTNPEANKTQKVAQGVFPLIPGSKPPTNNPLNGRVTEPTTPGQDAVSEIRNKTLGTGKVPRQKTVDEWLETWDPSTSTLETKNTRGGKSIPDAQIGQVVVEMALNPNSYNLKQNLNLGAALDKIKEDETRMNLIREAFLDALEKYLCNFTQVPKIFINEDFYKEAVNRRPNAIGEIPPEETEKLCQDPSFCLSLVKKDGWLLRKIPEKFRSEDVCLEALKNNTEAFYSIPKELINVVLKSYLKQIEEIPLPIIDFLIERLNKGMVDNFSDDDIKKIAMEALESNKRRSDDSKISLIKIPEKYRSLQISLAFVNQGFGSLEDIPEESRTEDVCKACLKRIPSTENFKLVPQVILEKLYEDKDFLLAIVNKRAPFLAKIPKEFHSEDLYLEALKNFIPGNGITITFSSMRPELITPKVLDAALKKYDLFTINAGERINEDEWMKKWSELAEYYTDNPTIEIPDRAWLYLSEQFIKNRIEKDDPRENPLLRKVLNICLRFNDVLEDTSFDDIAECKHQWLITLALKKAPWVVAENIKKPWILPTYFNLISGKNTYDLSKDEIIKIIKFLEQKDLNRLMESLNPEQLLTYISQYGLPKNYLGEGVSVDIINLVAKQAQSTLGKKTLEGLCKEDPKKMLLLLAPVWPMLDIETLYYFMVPILKENPTMLDFIPKDVEGYETLKETYKH